MAFMSTFGVISVIKQPSISALIHPIGCNHRLSLEQKKGLDWIAAI